MDSYDSATVCRLLSFLIVLSLIFHYLGISFLDRPRTIRITIQINSSSLCTGMIPSFSQDLEFCQTFGGANFSKGCQTANRGIFRILISWALSVNKIFIQHPQFFPTVLKFPKITVLNTQQPTYFFKIAGAKVSCFRNQVSRRFGRYSFLDFKYLRSNCFRSFFGRI